MSAWARAMARVKGALLPAIGGGGGIFNLNPSRILEPYPGAWQQNVELTQDGATANFAVFACMTLIAQDISKIGFLLETQSDDGLWQELDRRTFSPYRQVLLKPNGFQNAVQFRESWMLSKLSFGNAYALKRRDARNIVTGLTMLHPQLVMPLVAPNGDVFYQLNQDLLAQVPGAGVRIPASEIIHERFNCLFHPLIGLSPLYAAMVAANNGLAIQKNSSAFFANASVPGGVITVPEDITKDQADNIRADWNQRYSGVNVGQVAVLPGGATYAPTRATATDSQLLEQLKMTAQIICSVFHVPPSQIGMGDMPASKLNVEALEIEYVGKCLQTHIASMEASLTEGLELQGTGYRVALDTDALTRMDTAEKATAISSLVTGGIYTPNEGRRRFNLPPVEGGDTVYLQQQDFSIEALAARDKTNPLAAPSPSPAPAPAPAGDDQPDDTGTGNDDAEDKAAAVFAKALIDRLTSETADVFTG